MNKFYNLTNENNKPIEDKAPDWMDSFFDRKAEKKENPFKGVDNFLNIDIKK